MTAQTTPTSADLRKFGLIMAVFIGGLFGLLFPYLFSAEPIHWPIWPRVVAGVFFIWALVHPHSLRPVHDGWIKFGHVIGLINSKIVLGLLFFAIFLPMGLIMRLFGKDPMSRKLTAEAKTYRVESTQHSPKQMEHPY